MKRSPRPPEEPVVTRSRGLLMLVQGAFIAACSLGAYALVLFVEDEGLGRARTAAFAVLAVSQLFHSYNCRSLTESLFKIGVFTNKSLLLATGVSFVLQMAVVYLPPLQTVFKTEPLGLVDWLLVIAISSLPLWGTEIYKTMHKLRTAPRL
jgi:Ca2+-transporting ATPase